MIDLGPVWLTLRLATVTVLLLLVVGTPLAWWLAHTRARVKPLISCWCCSHREHRLAPPGWG